jgi:predicted Zn-dependent peptidase
MGEIQAIGFWADFIDDAYLPEPGSSLLEAVADLLGEVLLSPNTRGGLFLPQYVDSEKEKLLEDIRARVNDKGAYSRCRLIELMCAAEDYATDVLGSEDVAGSIGYVALTKHYKQLIATAPMEVFYCGTAEPERVENALRDALLLLPRGEIDYDLGTDIRMNAMEDDVRYYAETMDVTQGKLAIGFRLGECMEDPDHAAIRVMNAVFGGGIASKLFRNVREKLSLCYYAGSGVDILKGLMFVSSGIEPENYDVTLAEIFRQLDAVKAGDFTDEDLDVAKASLISDMLAVGDTAGQLEGFWLSQNLQGLDYGPDVQAALIEDVTREDVTAVANSVVCDMVYFMRGPEEESSEDDA